MEDPPEADRSKPKEKKEKKEKKDKKDKKDRKELVTEDGEDGSPSKKEKKEGKGKAQKLEVQGDFEPDMNLRQSVGSVGSMHASEVSLAEVEEQSPMASALEELPDEVSPGSLPDIPDADVDEDLQDVEEDKEEKKSKKDTGKKAKKEKKEKKDKKEKKQKKHEEEGQDQEPSKTHPETAELEATKVPDEIEAETNPLMIADADGLAPEDIEETALRGPIRLGSGDDLNIPERVSPLPKRFTLTGKEMVRSCSRCKLLWDGRLRSCPECGATLAEEVLKVSDLLSPTQRDFLRQAFTRYDVDRSGRLDGKELRMAVRELGWDSKQEVLDKWARLGGLQGLKLEEFENLIASGKLGKKTFKAVKGTASQAVKDEEQQMLQAAAGANLQFTTSGRQGRRMGLIPGKDGARGCFFPNSNSWRLQP